MDGKEKDPQEGAHYWALSIVETDFPPLFVYLSVCLLSSGRDWTSEPSGLRTEFYFWSFLFLVLRQGFAKSLNYLSWAWILQPPRVLELHTCATMSGWIILFSCLYKGLCTKEVPIKRPHRFREQMPHLWTATANSFEPDLLPPVTCFITPRSH